MSVNGITNVMTPTVECDASAQSMGDVTFGCEWKTTYNGLEEFKFMDCVFFLNGQQYFSDAGQGDMDSDTYKVARRTFYPVTGWQIKTVDVRIRGVYDGPGRWGDFMPSPTLEIQRPKPPEVELSIVEDDGSECIQVEVTPDEGDSYREVLWTRVEVRLPTERGTAVENFTVEPGDDTPFTKKYSTSSIKNALAYGGSRTFEVTAFSQGIAGDGDPTTAERVFAYPNVPVIDNVGITADLVTVFCDSKWDAAHPAGTLELEIAKSERTYEQVCASPNDLDWDTVKTVDGHTKVIWDTLANAKGDAAPGMRVFYRLKSTYDGNERYSKPYWVRQLYKAPMTVTLGDVNILSATSGSDGTSVRVDAEWSGETIKDVEPDKLKDIKFYTELSWSEREYAWQSTEEPDKFQFDWEDSPKNPAASMAHSGTVYISGLEEGEPVFIKARRIQKEGDEETPGKYSNTATATPVSAPAWVNLDVPSHVARGEAIPCTWTLGTEAEQSGWAISCVADPESIPGWVNMDSVKRKAALDARAVGIAEGTDAGGYCVLTEDELPKGATHLMLKCSATTGGLYTDSDYESVTIAQAPTCAISCDDVVTGLPLTVRPVAPQGANVAVTVVSRGITYATPTGYERQFAGDVVWAGVVTAGSDAVIDDCRLVDGCAYEIRAVAADPATGLRSPEVSRVVTVALERHAAYPDATVAVDAENRYASVVPIAPEGASPEDVCDVYRVTPDGAALIASGVEFGSTVRDRFAPYTCASESTKTAYRIAVKTPDGDCAWMDFDYEMTADGTRLDWSDKYLELDLNLSIEEEYAKGFEAREHMDGSVGGFWDSAIEHKATIASQIVRFEDAETKRLLREMASHPGAVFVRTGAGHAFDANVDLKNIGESYEDGTVAVKLSGREIDLTAAHMCGAGDVTAPPKLEGEA